MGVLQALALIPGISRAGATISAGQLTGLSRRAALDFSFLMALPIIFGAFVLTMIDVWSGTVMLPPSAIALTGFAASFLVSLLTVFSLRVFVVKFSLVWFTAYLVPLAGILIGYTVFG